MVPLTAKPEPVVLDLSQTAVIVVDMQNAFLSKGGMFDLAGFDLSGAEPAIAVNQRLLVAARDAGVKVIYLQMTYRPDLSDAGGPASPNYHKELGMVMMRAPRACRHPDHRGYLGLADRRRPGAAAGRSRRHQKPLQRILGYQSRQLSAQREYTLPAVHRGGDQCLRRKHGARCLFQRILARTGRGCDEPCRARFQSSGHLVEFRACVRLGNRCRQCDRDADG